MKTDLDDFIHDVRNPLNSISMNAELAKILVQQLENGTELKKTLDTIIRECKKCSEVLNTSENYFSDKN